MQMNFSQQAYSINLLQIWTINPYFKLVYSYFDLLSHKSSWTLY